MERYYFKTSGIMEQDCIEPCQIKEGVMIGSVSCQECENCIEISPACIHFKTIDWIKCKKIKEATLPPKQELI